MSAAEAVAAVMFAAVVLYAVFAGADFGSGVWDLTAGDARRGAPVRKLVDHAIGPVWEANHVWLIFVLVYFWSGFPSVFATVMRELPVPFWLAGLGIVARGSAFAFRKFAGSMRWAQTAGIVFAASSLITPFFLGAIAGAVASGRIRPGADVGLWSPWLTPTSILGGVLAVATCTFLAGVLLAAEADSLGDEALADALASKSLIGGAITGLVALAGLPVLLADADTLVDGLLGRGLPLIVLSGAGGLATMYLLWNRQLRPARVTAALAVASVVAGWGFAQYPWLLVDEVRIEDGAGDQATLVALLVAAGVAAVLVLPPLLYLFRLADTDQLGSESAGAGPRA